MRHVRCFAASLSVLVSASAFATSPEDVLQDRLQGLQPVDQVVAEHSLETVLPALQELNVKQAPCAEVTYKNNSKRIVTSYTAEGTPCRIYDLSFPTVRSIAKTLIGTIPVQHFGAEDFIQWLDDPSALESSVDGFRNSFSTNDLNQTWYGQLQFRNANENSGTPLEFRLSDIELGAPLRFSAEEAAGLIRLARLAGAQQSQIEAIVQNPESLLSNISLRWNDVSKAFEVFANLQILPLSGPTAMVDYNLQYKYAVEKLVRSALLNSLKYATKFIPNTTAQKIVTVVLNDVFEFMELEYAYQMNRLEGTLEANIAGTLTTAIPSADLKKGLNILAAQRSALVQQYILSKVLKQNFDLNALDKVGESVRYQDSKTRESLRLRLHSDLVTKKGCSTKIVENNFAICTLPNGNRELYSLLSNHQVLAWDLGANRIHNYNMRPRTAAVRSLAWSLSVAARVMPLPIPNFLTNQLVSISKGFATGGLLDDASLLGAIESTLAQPSPSEFATDIAPWLLRQNIIPFAPKTFGFENGIISANQSLLKMGNGN